jgi:hypothetical protein
MLPLAEGLEPFRLTAVAPDFRFHVGESHKVSDKGSGFGSRPHFSYPEAISPQRHVFCRDSGLRFKIAFIAESGPGIRGIARVFASL